MTDTDYRQIVSESLNRLAVLAQERDEIELQIAKLEQFIRATVNMLSEEEAHAATLRLDQLTTRYAAGLADAVRAVLEVSSHTWHTVAMVRDKLKAAGFDFSKYASNPLASVSTTLKRLKRTEVAAQNLDGVAAYRWKARPRVVRRKRLPATLALSNLGRLVPLNMGMPTKKD